jgi:AcrR family transcriptional regulator
VAAPRSTEPSGRREANKAATRTAILEAARRLFVDQGFERTSVREIAAAAGVTERTFYRYFEGKEGLLLEEVVSWMERLGDAIRARPADEGSLTAAHAAIQSVVRAARRPGGVGPLLRLLESERPLRSLPRPSVRPLRRLEDVIAIALAERAHGFGERDGTSPTFEDEIAARVSVAALRSAAVRHRTLLAAGGASPGIARLLDRAFATVATLRSVDQAGWVPCPSSKRCSTRSRESPQIAR